jgi:hypothetical protein
MSKKTAMTGDAAWRTALDEPRDDTRHLLALVVDWPWQRRARDDRGQAQTSTGEAGCTESTGGAGGAETESIGASALARLLVSKIRRAAVATEGMAAACGDP